MRFSRQVSHAAWGLALAVLLAAQAYPAGAQGDDPEEFYGEGSADADEWYHVIEPGQGPEWQIAPAVYARIAKADGRRSDPERLDTIIANGPGNWTWEWVSEGEKLSDRAKSAAAAGDGALAAKLYLDAARLFTIASSPHVRSNANAMAALAKARKAYRLAQAYIPGTFSVLAIPYEGRTFEAYLHLPQGQGPFPVVVSSNGSDVVKEQVGAGLAAELAMRGIAVLAIDMPGLGGSGAYDLTPDSDKLHHAAIDYLVAHPELGIDPRRIGAMGISFGGNAAARLFLRADPRVAGVVAACAPLNSSFNLPPQAYDQLPPLTIDGVRDRIGLSPAVPVTELAAALAGFSIETNPSGGDDKIATPLLVLATDADPVAPLDEVPLLTAHASDADVIVSYEPGHCPSEYVTASMAAAWFGRILGN